MPASRALSALPLRRFGIAALLVAALLLVVSAVVVNVGLQGLRTSRATVDRTNAVLREVVELRTVVRTAETGQRGYLLTGQERYLAPYRRAVRRLPEELTTLDQLVQDPGQRARLERMRPILRAKFDELAQTVDLRGSDPEAALRVVRTDRGQALTETFETLAAEFATAEQRLLSERVLEEEGQARLTTTAAAVTGLLALLSALAGVFLLFQQRADNQLLRYSQELERQVEERTARLSDANRELDAFAYTISHDLRAPLRAMHGYAEALVEDYGEALEDDGRGFAAAISAAALRMNALIEDILAYARMAREELHLRAVALDPIVERARAAQHEQRGDEQDIVVEHPLGSVVAHPVALAQVLDNLLSNAIKFVVPGVRPRVRVWAEDVGSTLRLWIEDNGIGIVEEHRIRIFEPFERLHGVESYPGTGIGLAIVRRATERMGGKCGVEPGPGSGSRFWIELPAVEEERTR